MLNYLFQAPNIFLMREARRRFLDSDEIFISGAGYVPLEEGDIWRRRRTRSIARRMHAWFFYYLLRPFNESDDNLVVQKLVTLITAWRNIVELPPTRIPLAYHDEATAQRAIALTCLLIDYADLLSDEDAAFVRQVLAESAELLAGDDFYSGGTNHGMYQDLALIVLSPQVAGGERFLNLAKERLNFYFSNAFTRDGIHKEQSPEYHCIVSYHLRQYTDFLKASDLRMAHQLEQICENTRRYATMSISPLGKFAPVSDTTNDLLASTGYSYTNKSPEFQYALSQGLLGTVPKDNSLLATHTGVAIYREDWKNPNSVYIYFSSAYNSDYHKHSDELSVYLVHRGLEILREAGPNGYDMEDPYTAYGFSSFAHNTLIVNGQGLPRTDPDAMDQVGIQTAESSEQDDFSVRGWNHRFPEVKHDRILSFFSTEQQHSGKKLSVLDMISAQNRNDYQILWHFGPDAVAELRDHAIYVRDREGTQIAEMTITSDSHLDLCIVQGQTKPKIQGWYFPKMGVCCEAQTLIVSFSGDNTELQTDIVLT